MGKPTQSPSQDQYQGRWGNATSFSWLLLQLLAIWKSTGEHSEQPQNMVLQTGNVFGSGNILVSQRISPLASIDHGPAYSM